MRARVTFLRVPAGEPAPGAGPAPVPADLVPKRGVDPRRVHRQGVRYVRSEAVAVGEAVPLAAALAAHPGRHVAPAARVVDRAVPTLRELLTGVPRLAWPLAKGSF